MTQLVWHLLALNPSHRLDPVLSLLLINIQWKTTTKNEECMVDLNTDMFGGHCGVKNRVKPGKEGSLLSGHHEPQAFPSLGGWQAPCLQT